MAAPLVCRLCSSAKRAKSPLAFFLTALLAVGSAAPLTRNLSLNLTPSLPRGLYALTEPEPIAPGDIVSFPIPASVQVLVSDRHYLPPGATLLKHVVAVEGDRVCLQGDRLLINDRELAVVRRTDSRGRPLAPYHFCGPIPTGHVFVASAAPNSFDSRYFGPVALPNLKLARSLWTY